MFPSFPSSTTVQFNFAEIDGLYRKILINNNEIETQYKIFMNNLNKFTTREIALLNSAVFDSIIYTSRNIKDYGKANQIILYAKYCFNNHKMTQFEADMTTIKTSMDETLNLQTILLGEIWARIHDFVNIY